MAEPLIFINSYPLREGALRDYLAAVPDWLRFLEENHPRMLHFAAYLSDDNRDVTVVQVHPDAESMDHQLKVIAGGHVEKWAEFIDWEKMSLMVCGSPGETTVEHIKQVAGSGVPVSFKRPTGGFNRFPKI